MGEFGFVNNKKRARRSRCLACEREYSRKYYEKNRKSVLKKQCARDATRRRVASTDPEVKRKVRERDREQRRRNKERNRRDPNRLKEKKCCRCKEVKPVSKFSRAWSKHDGYNSYCYPCKTARKQESRNKWNPHSAKANIKIKCNMCEGSFPESEFYVNNARMGGLQRCCKRCYDNKLIKGLPRHEYRDQWHEQNKERIAQCPKLKAKKKEYYKANKEKIKKMVKEYRKKNRQKVRAHQTKYRKKRMASDPAYRARYNARKYVSSFLRQAKIRKKDSCSKMLGCTYCEFKAYIEAQFSEGMSWENYGEWHLDHIRPLASFDLTAKAEQAKACHHTNLQPLWAVDNMKKSSTWKGKFHRSKQNS